MSLESLIPHGSIISCHKEESVLDIAGKMKEHNVGTVIVVDGERPLGIITDRDLVTRCLASGFEGRDLTAEDVMSAPLQTVPSHEGLYQVVSTMQQKRIRRIAVIDRQGKVIGILSAGDLLELLALEMTKLVSASGAEREELIRRNVA